MNNAGRKTIYFATLAMLMLFGSGCILVPYSYETVSQEVIGALTDKTALLPGFLSIAIFSECQAVM